MVAENTTIQMMENKKDPICPFRILAIYRMMCHPSQKYLYCYPASKSQRFQWIAQGHSEWLEHNPLLHKNYSKFWAKLYKLGKTHQLEDEIKVVLNEDLTATNMEG